MSTENSDFSEGIKKIQEQFDTHFAAQIASFIFMEELQKTVQDAIKPILDQFELSIAEISDPMKRLFEDFVKELGKTWKQKLSTPITVFNPPPQFTATAKEWAEKLKPNIESELPISDKEGISVPQIAKIDFAHMDEIIDNTQTTDEISAASRILENEIREILSGDKPSEEDVKAAIKKFRKTIMRLIQE